VVSKDSKHTFEESDDTVYETLISEDMLGTLSIEKHQEAVKKYLKSHYSLSVSMRSVGEFVQIMWVGRL
jgi:hypothetical protein